MLNGVMGLGMVFSAHDLASAKISHIERKYTSLDERVTGGAARMSQAFKQIGLGLAVFTAGALAIARAPSRRTGHQARPSARGARS